MCKFKLTSYRCGHQTAEVTLFCELVQPPNEACTPEHINILPESQVESQEYTTAECPNHVLRPTPLHKPWFYEGRHLFRAGWVRQLNASWTRIQELSRDFQRYWIETQRRLPVQQPSYDILWNPKTAHERKNGHLLNDLRELEDTIFPKFIHVPDITAMFDTITKKLESVDSLVRLLEKQIIQSRLDIPAAKESLLTNPPQDGTLDRPGDKPIWNWNRDEEDIQIMAGVDRASLQDALREIENMPQAEIGGWSISAGTFASFKGRPLPLPPGEPQANWLGKPTGRVYANRIPGMSGNTQVMGPRACGMGGPEPGYYPEPGPGSVRISDDGEIMEIEDEKPHAVTDSQIDPDDMAMKGFPNSPPRAARQASGRRTRDPYEMAQGLVGRKDLEAQQVSQRSTGQAARQSSQWPSQQAAQQPPRQTSRQIPRPSSQQASRPSSHQTPPGSSQQAAHQTPRPSSQQASRQASQKAPQKVSDKTSES